MAASYTTIGEVAKQVEIPRWRLAYLIERGDLPGPSLQVPGRRLFSEKDVDCIRKTLESSVAGSGRAPG
jgi:DNA-binding transcriptional MerR regulator